MKARTRRKEVCCNHIRDKNVSRGLGFMHLIDGQRALELCEHCQRVIRNHMLQDLLLEERLAIDATMRLKDRMYCWHIEEKMEGYDDGVHSCFWVRIEGKRELVVCTYCYLEMRDEMMRGLMSEPCYA